ncbi:MAG: rhomboid family intramembrane serine protease [Myxococcales bacterium]|nr:rhomboid family intramembrane serine protease [Myxococcales bacterium]
MGRWITRLAACGALSLLLACGSVEGQENQFKRNVDTIEALATKQPMRKADIMAKLAEFKAEKDKIMASSDDKKTALARLNSRMNDYVAKFDPSMAKKPATGSKLGTTAPGKRMGTTAPGAAPGMAKPGMAPGAAPGMAKPGMAPGAAPGMANPGMAKPGMAPGAAPGMAKPGMAPGAAPGMAQPGMAPGAAPGMAKPGMAPGAAPGMAQPGMAPGGKLGAPRRAAPRPRRAVSWAARRRAPRPRWAASWEARRPRSRAADAGGAARPGTPRGARHLLPGTGPRSRPVPQGSAPPAGSVTDEPQIFPLAPAWLRGRALSNLLWCGVATWGAYELMQATALGPPYDQALPLGVGLAVVAFAMAVLGVGKLLRRRRATVVVGPDGCRFPPDTWGLRDQAVAFDDIEALVLQRGARGGRLVVATPSRVHLLPATAFPDATTPTQLFQLIRQRIAVQPGGLARLAELDRGITRARDVMRQGQARITRVLLLTIGAVFLVQLQRPSESPLSVVRLGANVPILVADGQWFRLISATFLHGGWVHILFNGLALHALGGLLERLMGPHRLWVVYAVAGIAGSLASLLAGRSMPSIGASGAVFGLLGALAVLQLHRSAGLPAGLRQSRRWWTVILGLQVALPLMVRTIDWLAHAGGFLAGGVATALLVRAPYRHGADAGGATRAVAWALAAVFGVAGVQTVLHAREDPGPDMRRTFGALLADPDLAAQTLNLYAWTALEDPAADAALIEAARAAAARAIAKTPEGPDAQETLASYRDTVATALYRAGDFDAALEAELDAFAQREDDFMATQIARFAEARAVAGAAPYAPGTAPAGATLRAAGDRVWLEAGGARPVTVFARVRDGRNDVPVGLLRARFDHPDTPSRGPRPLEDGFTLHVAAVLPGAPADQAPDSWLMWRDDAAARRLPLHPIVREARRGAATSP